MVFDPVLVTIDGSRLRPIPIPIRVSSIFSPTTHNGTPFSLNRLDRCPLNPDGVTHSPGLDELLQNSFVYPLSRHVWLLLLNPSISPSSSSKLLSNDSRLLK